MSSQIDFDHCGDLSNEVVDAELGSSVNILLEHRPDPANDLVGTLTVLDDTREGGTRLIEIGVAFAIQRKAALALVTIAASGWLIS